MDTATLKALKGSIAKWKEIAAGTGFDMGANNCPLCEMFIDRDCRGCPVSKATGQQSCEGSPYQNWRRIRSDYCGVDPTAGREWTPNGSRARSARAKAAARKELRFLESLLPVTK